MITDSNVGELLCSKCGFVVKERIEETGPEWRSFSRDEKDEKGRTILQDLGMDKRKEDPDYWVKAAMRKVVAIAAESPGTKIVFVPDTRFTNEARAIKFLGGEIWRIERYTEYNTGVRVPYDNGLTPEQKVHPSEIELDNWPFDLTIHSSNMADLFEGVKKALDRLGFA